MALTTNHHGNSAHDDRHPPLGAMADLTHDELVAECDRTLSTPRRSYGMAGKVLFRLLDAVYGKPRTLSKYKVLEIVARVPYQSWEQIGYIAITHTYEHAALARRIFDRVLASRRQEDNEQWHLLILVQLTSLGHHKEGRLRYRLVPQLLAVIYYRLSWALFVIRPAWSYSINADFEDHAEHEYAELVAEHPEWESMMLPPEFLEGYAAVTSWADLFRQMSYDEGVHKAASAACIAQARFS